MTKEKYKEHIKNTRDSVFNEIAGYHELGNVLESLSNYINIRIELLKRLGDVDYE